LDLLRPSIYRGVRFDPAHGDLAFDDLGEVLRADEALGNGRFDSVGGGCADEVQHRRQRLADEPAVMQVDGQYGFAVPRGRERADVGQPVLLQVV